nr:hypothetical protein [Tanacetum cinerariifolium]
MNACDRCVTIESELQKDFIKKDCYDTHTSFSQESAPTFAKLFEINDLKDQSQANDTVILKLREKLQSLTGNVKERKVKREIEEIETLNIELDHRVTKLVAENEHLKQTCKQLYDSIKPSRVQSQDQCDDLIKRVNLKSAEISDLKASLQEKVLVITALKESLSKLKGKDVVNEAVPLHSIDPELLKIDVAPLAPKLRKNRTAHTDYIRHTLEEAATLREIVESERLINPFNTSLDYACKYTKQIQEMLIIIQQTCPCITDLGTKLLVVTPKNNHKQIRLTEHIPKSRKTTPSTNVVSNTPVLSSTGVNLLSSASGSKSQDNTKNDRIQRTPRKAKKNKLEDHLRTVRPILNTKSVVDTKATSSHMTGERSQLINFVQKFLGTVKFENDHVAKIMGYGNYQIGNVTISRVYYVEGLGHNLFYVGQFCDSDLEVAFRQHTCFIRNLDGVDLLTCSRGNNLYTLSLQDMMAFSPICLLSKASKTKSWLWHCRLSHLNFGAINHIARHGLVRGLSKLKFEKDHLCSACAMGKSTKKTHKPKSEDTNQEKLYLLHMDLCGPMRVESVNEKNAAKGPGLSYTEFVNQTLRDYYEEVGISHETSVARSPHQNGVVERHNRTIIKVARIMLIYAQALLFLWAEAVATACFTQNQSIIRLRHGKTPYEHLHNKLPDLSFFYVFGALCYPTNDSENLGKLQPKADIWIFIGYALTKKAFRIYNRRTSRIVETIHVDSDELTAMASEQSNSGPALNEMTPGTISSGLVVDHQAAEVIALIADVIPPVHADLTIIPQDVEEDNLDMEVAHMGNNPLFGVPIQEATSAQSSSMVSPQPIVQPNHPITHHNSKWTKDHPLQNIIGQLSRPVSTQLQLHKKALFCYYDAFLTSVEPKTYKEVLTQSCWIEAMQEELNEFERREVWELVPRPDKVMVITLKWIYKVKLDELGGILKNKARLVARGHRKEEGIEFEESFALVARQKLFGFFSHMPHTRTWRNGNDLLLVQIYVDDIIFAASTLELCDLFSNLMCSKFKMLMMGKISFFLGLQISQSPRGIFINQSKYALESLKKYGFESCDPVDTSMVEKSKLDEDREGKAIDPSHYRGMIGTLLYLTASRPDLQFAICMCARYQARPTEKHVYAVKRIFRYLRGTVNRGLWYPKDSSVALTALAHADHAGC